MTAETLTLNVPKSLYDQLRERAGRTNRTVEDETLDVLTAAVASSGRLSPDLEEAVAPLTLMSDEELWRAAHSTLASEGSQRLEELHLKWQREGLTNAEIDAQSALVRQYERTMVVRARAAELLHQRGQDVAGLLNPP